MNYQKLHVASIVGVSAIVGGLIILGGFYWYMSSIRKDVGNMLSVQFVEAQQAMVHSMYGTRDGVVDGYVSDCSPALRGHFDRNLDSLNALSWTELQETSQLFEACASYYADLRAALHERLVAESDKLLALLEISNLLTPQRDTTPFRADLEEFVRLDSERSTLLARQLPIQRDIIDLLMDGYTPNSDNIRLEMEEARSIAESGTVVARQIEAVFLRLQAYESIADL